MKLDDIVTEARGFAAPYRVTKGRQFRLDDIDPADVGALEGEDKPAAQEALANGIAALAELQERLYADNRWSLLIIFQALDAAGKDSAIKHVMSGVNPQGCRVTGFKVPSAEELDHDYLWRAVKELPERGQIGIFNRSYYEELLVVRVHPALLERQRIPATLVHKRIWKERAEDIRHFERYLAHNGVIVRKFFLLVSRKEQRRRFLERLDKPEKHWKFNPGDLRERDYWKDYMRAYEDAVRRTASRHAPWYVVPADHKWFTRLVVAAAIIETLDALDLRYPPLDSAQKREIERARRELAAKK